MINICIRYDKLCPVIQRSNRPKNIIARKKVSIVTRFSSIRKANLKICFTKRVNYTVVKLTRLNSYPWGRTEIRVNA